MLKAPFRPTLFSQPSSEGHNVSEGQLPQPLCEPSVRLERLNITNHFLRFFWDHWPTLKKTVLLMAIALPVGLGLTALHIPIGWLLGAMLTGIVYVMVQGRSQKLYPGLATVGQVIIAIATAARFSWETLTHASEYALPLMLCIVITAALSMLNGYLLARWTGIEYRTSLLGSIPGAGPSIVALSEEMGANGLVVAVLQYLRILLVSAVIPILASLLFASQSVEMAIAPAPSATTPTLPLLPNVLVLVTCGLLGIWGGKLLKLPSALFLGPFLAALIAFWLSPTPLYLPQPLLVLGLLLVGLTIGLKFDWQTVRNLLKAVILESILVLLLILVCMGVAYGFHLITQVDALTAVLGSTPGGISTMIASAIQLGGDSALVMTMQMTRMMLILMVTPWLANFLNGRRLG